VNITSVLSELLLQRATTKPISSTREENRCRTTALFNIGHFGGHFAFVISWLSIQVAARSKEWVCGHSPAEIVGSNPIEGMDVSCECCVLSGRGLCDGLITCLEESHRMWCIVVCGLETS